MDRVHEELGRDARFPLVLSESEQSQPWNDDDGRVAVAKLWRVRLCESFVVGGVVRPVFRDSFGDPILDDRQILRARVPRDEHRRDAGAQEVIGTARAHLAEVFRPLRVRECDRVVAAVVVTDHASVRRHGAAQRWKEIDDRRFAVRNWCRDLLPAEERCPAAILVVLDELAHLVDGADAAQVAFLLSVAPREEAVAAEDQPVTARVGVDRALQHQRELESRALPGHPDDLPAVLLVELFQLPASVGARRQGDGPVRMEMVDMIERKKRVKRRVDGSGHAVLSERAKRIEPHHLVLERFTPIAGDQTFELVQIQHGEAGGPHRSQIASAALHSHHTLWLAGKRIGEIELRARVASAEVRDAKVRAEKIRAISEQLQRTGGQRGRLLVVPEVLQESSFDCRRIRHRSTPRTRETADSARPIDPLPTARTVRPGRTDR